MITPARHNLIFLVTGSSGRQHGYEDRWSDDGLVFSYFGEGQSEDMKFTKGNLALREHVSRGEDVHLFEEVPAKSGYLRYKGQMVCTGFATVDAPDTQGNTRKAILFDLVPLETFEVFRGDVASTPEPAAIEELERDSLDVLRRKALADSADFRSAAERRTLYRVRSRAVRMYVLRRAAGVCEGCGSAAPFLTADKQPYLEPHHIRRLTDGGPIVQGGWPPSAQIVIVALTIHMMPWTSMRHLRTSLKNLSQKTNRREKVGHCQLRSDYGSGGIFVASMPGWRMQNLMGSNGDAGQRENR